MSSSAWFVGILASLLLSSVQAQEIAGRSPQRVDGLTVHFSVQPAPAARNWAGFHEPTDADTAVQPARPDLDRHVIVVVTDDATGRRVDDANIEITMTPANRSSRSYVHRLDLMSRGDGASYGTVVTVDPDIRYVIDVAIRRPSTKAVSHAQFAMGPAPK